MRFLLKYPITEDEVLAVVNTIPNDEQNIGGVEGHIRQGLIEFFNVPENINEFLEHLKEHV